ncbi:MAG: hypothetical protein Q8L27_03580 [archaeon]|nr:hypothetical protein [archaeon]
MNKRNLEIFGWRDLGLKLEHVIMFIIFLVVLGLIILYFLNDSKSEIEKLIQVRINETKNQVQQPIVEKPKENLTEETEIQSAELSDYETMNWDTASFSSVCKQDYDRYRDDVNDVNSQIDTLKPTLEDIQEQLDDLQREMDGLQSMLDKRKSQLKDTILQCKS